MPFVKAAIFSYLVAGAATFSPRVPTNTSSPSRSYTTRGSGAPAASSASFTLDGEWDFTLKPTLDNKWGDFRLPVRERFIGAEVRRVQMAGAEKLLGKPAFRAILGPYTSQPSGAPTLVPESDKRIAINSTEAAFSDLTE